jgi:hypothetical protein
MCGQRKKSVRPHTTITIGLNSGAAMEILRDSRRAVANELLVIDVILG